MKENRLIQAKKLLKYWQKKLKLIKEKIWQY